MNYFPGKKTYLLVVGGLVTIVGMFLSGDMTIAEAVQRALEVTSIATLRLAVR